MYIETVRICRKYCQQLKRQFSELSQTNFAMHEFTSVEDPSESFIYYDYNPIYVPYNRHKPICFL